MVTGRSKQIKKAESRSVGRVAADSRGHNVWQWDDRQFDSTTVLVQRLDNSALALEPTQRVPLPDLKCTRVSAGHESAATDGATDLEIEQTFQIKVGDGFDPYNSS